jgi:UDP-N-acetylglucosamine--N-acetylmuramyl-(pentapeptide) pyrophosphoryl-undecaprenol N-acetylglucosamine transferase
MTTLFLATSGGHLQQLKAIAPRVPPDGPALWVTDANEQSRSLLGDVEGDSDVEFVPFVGVRDVAGVLHCLPTAHRLWRERGVSRVISTGSGIALGYLPYLAARGTECHYIESATRVGGPSLTGRLLVTPGIHRYTQSPHWAGRHWRYRGSVFDGFAARTAPRPAGDGPIQVVVTVGTDTENPFSRLIEHLTPILAADGALSSAMGAPVHVLWQTGCTPISHLPITAVPFLPAGSLDAAIAAADIVISHAGTGSALAALTAGRLPVLAGRTPDRGETIDGHQSELAAELARRSLAIHRDPDGITVDDLILARNSTVDRVTSPPAFELAS